MMSARTGWLWRGDDVPLGGSALERRMCGEAPISGGANPDDDVNMAPFEAVGMTKVPLLCRAEDVDETSEVLEVDGVAGPAGDGAAVDMSCRDSVCWSCSWDFSLRSGSGGARRHRPGGGWRRFAGWLVDWQI
jgi:hypothetical protein